MTLTKYRIIHSKGCVEFPVETDAIAYRNIHHPGCVIETIVIEISDIDEKQSEKLSILWNSFNDFAESQMDFNSRHSINLLLVDPNISPTRLQKILAYADWWRNLWVVYATKKQIIINGGDYVFNSSDIGDCPYTIWDISA